MSIIENTVKQQLNSIEDQLAEIAQDLDWATKMAREHQSIIDFHAENPDRKGKDIYGIRNQLQESQTALIRFQEDIVRDSTRQEFLTKFRAMLVTEYGIDSEPLAPLPYSEPRPYTTGIFPQRFA